MLNVFSQSEKIPELCGLDEQQIHSKWSDLSDQIRKFVHSQYLGPTIPEYMIIAFNDLPKGKVQAFLLRQICA